jgi:hypothetical protein
MIVTLSPIASNKDTTVTIREDKIIVDQKTYDLSSILEGTQVEAQAPATGLIKNIDGTIHITIAYHYNMFTSEPHQSPDINDYIFDVSDGKVTCPIVRSDNSK